MLFSVFGYAQSRSRLFSKLNHAESDSQSIRILNQITESYLDEILIDSANIINQRSLSLSEKNNSSLNNFEGFLYAAQIQKKLKHYPEAFQYIHRAIEISNQTKHLHYKIQATNQLAGIYEASGQGQSAIDNYSKALKLATEIDDKKEMASSKLGLGIYYKKQNKASEGLQHLHDAISLAEEIKDSSVIFTACINLGTLYEKNKDYNKAMNSYRKALQINNSEKNENDRAICYFKIGRLFQTMKNSDSARFYLTETLKLHQKRNDQTGLIFDYASIASFYAEDKKIELAEENYLKALNQAVKFGDTVQLNLVNSYVGDFYYQRKNNTKLALNYFSRALDYNNSQVARETVMMLYDKISKIHYQEGRYKEAFDAHVKYKAWSDSAYNIHETKKQTELILSFEFEQAQKKIEEETKIKEAINQSELEKERLQRYFLLSGLALISLLLIVAVRSYRNKQKAHLILQKQKQEIEHQKKLVEQKNHEINDSINYALRIQTASLPEQKELETYFPNYGLFFRPKDVVSGDFYWAAGQEDFSLIAVADCTGHGVPGAITSMIGSMLLNEIFYVKKIYQPQNILKELNRLVKLTLRQEAASLSNDGMDISLCYWDKRTNNLYYAGANRPLYMVRNGEVQEIKPNKLSIGGSVPLIQDYEYHHIPLLKGDTVIMTSDGFADQFGGNKEKKYTTKAFKTLLSEIHDLNPKEQKNRIEQSFDKWRGTNEQTDDVLVFIFKLP